MMRHFLGVDVGGTNTRLLLMNDDGEFSGYRKIATADWAQQADPLAALGRLIAGHCEDRQVAQVMLGGRLYDAASMDEVAPVKVKRPAHWWVGAHGDSGAGWTSAGQHSH